MDEYPAAVDCLTRNRHFDNVVPGAGDVYQREEQITQSLVVLAVGGFKFKYVIQSGNCKRCGTSALPCGFLSQTIPKSTSSLNPCQPYSTIYS